MFSKLVKVGCVATTLVAAAFAADNGDNDTLFQFREAGAIKLTTAAFTPGTNYHCYAKNARTDTTYYFLQGSVVVGPTCTLTVHPGARIYGNFSTTTDAANGTSILVISRGGVLHAEGTVDSPIVFTSLRDNAQDNEDLGPGAKGLWGGIVMCGYAPTLSATSFYPEGLPPGLESQSGVPVAYGGYDPADYSGKLKYVSIRHGGVATASNSETNGLSLYGVGNSTEISYLEVFANSDDGIEFFGGTVNTNHISMMFNSDDQFDLDEGYNGKNQFWFAIEQEYDGDHAGEWDGKHALQDTLCSAPTIFNFTFVGSGQYASKVSKTNALGLRDSLGGLVANGIITEFAGYVTRRHANENGMLGKPFGAGLDFKGNMIYACGNSTTAANDTLFNNSHVNPVGDIPYIQQWNTIRDPGLLGVAHWQTWGIDPRPGVNSNVYTFDKKQTEPAGLVSVPYIGAFDSTNLWIGKWTAAHELGYLVSAKCPTKTRISCNFAPCSKYASTNIQMPLEFIIEAPLSSSLPDVLPPPTIIVDGVNMTSTFLDQGPTFTVSTTGCAKYRAYRVVLPTAGYMVPQKAGKYVRPVKGPHTIRLVWKLNDQKTYEYTTSITLY